MLQSDQVETLICLVAALDRPALIRQFRSYPAPFPVDFTPEFLETVPLERLRHIFVALCLQCQHVPALASAATADVAAAPGNPITEGHLPAYSRGA